MAERLLLYSYRRCPYAMRARMALASANIQCDVHEVDLKDKPAHMLQISPKGTVPVLQVSDGHILEESLDIVFWALDKDNPLELLNCDLDQAKELIAANDGAFKGALDRYKYPSRFPDEDCSRAREQGVTFLKHLNDKISKGGQLIGGSVSVADICIFPFIRQFANVDHAWFDALALAPLQKWLSDHLKSDLFQHVIKKHKESSYLLL